MKSKPKIFLIAAGALLSLTAVVGIGIGLSKAASTGSSTKVSSGDTYLPSLPETSGTASSGGSSSSSGSSTSNPEIQDGPYITCDKQVLNLSVGIDDDDFPYGTFTPQILNTDEADGQNAANYLAICATEDNSFLEYLDFKTRDANNNEINAVSGSAVIVFSGRPVKCIMKQRPPLAGGYSVRLRVYSPYYDSATVRWFIDVNLSISQ